MRCRHARRFRRATVFVPSRGGGGEYGCTVAAMVSSVVMAIGRGYGNEDTMQKQTARKTATRSEEKTEGTTMKEQKRRKQTRLKKIGIGRSSDPRSSRNPKRAAHQNLNVAVENFQQGERARSLQEREGELQQRPSAHCWRFQRLK